MAASFGIGGLVLLGSVVGHRTPLHVRLSIHIVMHFTTLHAYLHATTKDDVYEIRILIRLTDCFDRHVLPITFNTTCSVRKDIESSINSIVTCRTVLYGNTTHIGL